MAPLGALGFDLVGYGCTTCIGNCGPLDEPVARAVEEHGLVVAAVLSGNRNFEGRIHPAGPCQLPGQPAAGRRLRPGRPRRHRPDARAAGHRAGRPAGHAGRHLAIARRGPLDHRRRPSRPSSSARPTPRSSTATTAGARCPSPTATATPGTRPRPTSPSRPSSQGLTASPPPPRDIVGARVLAVLGDSVTTDHISPAGSIPAWSPAGTWLQDARRDAARVQLLRRPARPPRGHDARHLRQHPAAQRPGRAGRPVHHAPARRARRCSCTTPPCATRPTGVPLIVLAGKEYGSGSSRDWAAKGTTLLGVRAVLAESYERIHRSNLVGHGRAAAPVPAR